MKIILIGATGYTGSRICYEALTRGHDITAIVRSSYPQPLLLCATQLVAEPSQAPHRERRDSLPGQRLELMGCGEPLRRTLNRRVSRFSVFICLFREKPRHTSSR